MPAPIEIEMDHSFSISGQLYISQNQMRIVFRMGTKGSTEWGGGGIHNIAECKAAKNISHKAKKLNQRSGLYPRFSDGDRQRLTGTGTVKMTIF